MMYVDNVCVAPDDQSVGGESAGESADEETLMGECLNDNGACDVNATCEATEGEVTCTCNDGYDGDGLICTRTCPLIDGSRVQVCGQKLYVDQQDFFMKGMNWNPVDRGANYSLGDPANFVGRVEQNVDLMSAVGINIVKTYSLITDPVVLDALLSRGIYLVQPLFNYYDPNGDRQYSTVDINTIDTVIADSQLVDGTVHPAIIM
jgi:hypothetical protein